MRYFVGNTSSLLINTIVNKSRGNVHCVWWTLWADSGTTTGGICLNDFDIRTCYALVQDQIIASGVTIRISCVIPFLNSSNSSIPYARVGRGPPAGINPDCYYSSS